MLEQGLLAVLGLWTLVVMAPGPDTLAVAATSVGSSRRDGLLVAVGCGVATAIWAGGSMLGLAILFANAAWLFTIVKIAGAAYLTYLGVRLLLSAARPTHDSNDDSSLSNAGMRAFRLGLFTDLANPKAAAFFSSLFAVALPLDAAAETKVATVFAVAAIALLWYTLVAVMRSSRPIAKIYLSARRWIEGIAGAAFVAFGAKLALSRD